MNSAPFRHRSGPAAPRRLGRVLALILRHRPDEVGIVLDPGGFASLDALARGLSAQPGWGSVTVDEIVQTAAADARRYEVRDGLIRARYGHTVPIEQPGEPAFPPEWLYHGTPPADVDGLLTAGLQPTSRQYVHLSTTPAAAREVGRRHAPDAVVVVVLARRAHASDVVFRRVTPDLYLTGKIPARFLLPPNEPFDPSATPT
jgi:putative RNA 2'-phosphotransferase